MCVPLTAENKPKILENDGVNLILAAMRSHNGNHMVQRNACWTLWNLVAQSGMCCATALLCERPLTIRTCNSTHNQLTARARREVAESDAVALVLDAMANFNSDEKEEHLFVHQKATGVLDNLAVACMCATLCRMST